MTPRRPFGSRAFRLLLCLYPAYYRERYGAEMEECFRRDRAASGGRLGFWIRLVLDHVEAAWAVRRRRPKTREEGTMMKMLDDVRAAVRTLVRSPRFTIFAVVTLALGVGAVTAVFTVVERVVLRPLPYPGSERMTLVGIDPRHDPGSVGPLSPALLAALEAYPGPAESVAAGRTVEAILRGSGDPERVEVTEVSEGLFAFFDASPVVGRLLQPADHVPGAEPVVVLGHATWRERFGSDPGVIGDAVRLDDRLHTVVGVLDEGFMAPPEVAEAEAYWVPLEVDWEERGSFFLAGVVRLRPGATMAAFDEHADAVVDEVYAASGLPTFLLGAAVSEYRAAVIGPVGRDLTRVLAAVSLLLVIACVNVAGLLLTRGAERRHELGMHFALGAPRGRLVRKLLSESLLLALVGGLAGACLAWGAVELFRAYAPGGLPRLEEIALDGRGLTFALVVAGTTVVLFGLLPALRSTRRVAKAVRGATGATLSRSEARLRGSLVVAETALAVVLAVGSGLLAHDLVEVTREDPGFRPEGLVAMSLNLEPRYGEDEWTSVWDRLVDGSRALPGAASVAVATQAPWDGTRTVSTYRPQGWQGEDAVFAVTVGVGGEYVEALGTDVAAGRALRPADRGGAPVVMVNESFASRYWPGESGVGKAVASGEADEPVYRVVGVLADVSTRPGRDVFPHVFLPLDQASWRQMEVLVRTSGDVGEVAAGLREIVRRVDPALPVTGIRTMETLSSRALAGPRFYAALFGGFALVALLLAVVGVYGTTAYATRARLREAGIRLVLGARSEQVVRTLVLRSGVAVAVGVALGLVGAAVGSPLLAESLRHVGPRDWLTYLAVGAVVVGTGVLAAWIPATVAGRTDPMTTLRQE